MYKVTARYGASSEKAKTLIGFHRDETSAIVSTCETEEYLKSNGFKFVDVSRSDEFNLSCNILALEVGRKCNMRCDHCLRGEAENAEMEIDVAYKAINMFDYIGSITFTGGEPVLYEKNIIKIIDLILANDIQVGSFYIATNGTSPSFELMFALSKLYAHCQEKEFCEYTISADRWHKFPEFDAWLSAFSFVCKRQDIPETALLDEGRAKKNGIGSRTLKTSSEFDFDGYCVDLLYVNAFGEMFADCDYSYDTQRSLDVYDISDIYSGTVTPEVVFAKTFKKPLEEA